MSTAVEPGEATVRRALVVAAEPSATLTAIGSAFDDIVVADLRRLEEELAGSGDDVVIVLDGAVGPAVTAALVTHVATRPRTRLAWGVSVEPTILDGSDTAPLRVLGGGYLGDLPVTWWTAADVPVGAVSPMSPGPGGANRGEPPADAFAAHAQLLRERFELERNAADGVAEEPLEPMTPAPEPADADVSLVVRGGAPSAFSLRSLLGWRLPLVVVLLGIGVAAGIGVAQAWDGDVQHGATLLLLAAVTLVLAWGVRAMRGLTLEMRAQVEQTVQFQMELGKTQQQLSKRLRASESGLGRVREALRQVEARLAVLSGASANASRPRPGGDSDRSA